MEEIDDREGESGAVQKDEGNGVAGRIPGKQADSRAKHDGAVEDREQLVETGDGTGGDKRKKGEDMQGMYAGGRGRMSLSEKM